MPSLKPATNRKHENSTKKPAIVALISSFIQLKIKGQSSFMLADKSEKNTNDQIKISNKAKLIHETLLQNLQFKLGAPHLREIQELNN